MPAQHTEGLNVRQEQGRKRNGGRAGREGRKKERRERRQDGGRRGKEGRKEKEGGKKEWGVEGRRKEGSETSYVSIGKRSCHNQAFQSSNSHPKRQ